MFIKGYSSVTVSKSGIISDYMPVASYGVHFRLENDVRVLFPYLNAYFPEAEYFDRPEYIRFILNGVMCTIYPTEVLAAPFSGQNEAQAFITRLIRFLNDLYLKKDAITPNHRKIKQVSILDIFKLLPQTNCMACGFSTCMAFAAALSKGDVRPDQCPDLARPIYENAVYPVYDDEGNLTATVALEIDTQKIKQERSEQKKYIQALESQLFQEKGKSKASPEKETPEVQTDLTDREKQVLRLVAEGATNVEISEALSISPHTVKSHVVHIFNKLGVNDRTQAAVWATRYRII
jgi:ArsR family metal-binding transcriptional regulator/DNA-binding CsgD family transcriptional regulator